MSTPTCSQRGAPLSLLWLVCTFVVTLNGQQSPLPSYLSSTATADSSQPQLAAKIGLAPHDRPACQLPPIGAQRRHLSPGGMVNLGNEPQPTEYNNSSSQAATGSTPSLLLSSPNVVSLQQQQQQSLLGGSQNHIPKNQLTVQPASTRKQFDSSERLRQLRQLLVSNQYDAYLVTPNDEHGSEYVTDYDRRLRFISGFTGSNGYALVLLDRAVLFTDGRYALQADQDLDCNWWLVVGDEPLADIHLWLRANAAKGIKVATDARLMPLQSFDYLDGHLRRLESEFALISQDLVDVVWNNQQQDGTGNMPLRPQSVEQLFVHPIQFAGNLSWQDKLIRVADLMSELQARHYIVSQLDDIAWLLNLRGNDIPMSPLFKAYLLISRQPSADLLTGAQQPIKTSQQQQSILSNGGVGLSSGEQLLTAPQVLQVQASQSIKVTLYVDLKKVNQLVREHLQVDNGTVVSQRNRWGQTNDSKQQESPIVSTRIQLELKDYDVFIMDIRDKLARQLQGRLLLNGAANVAIHVLAKQYEDRVVLTESLIQRLKAVKSDGEVNGMRLAHWRDSLAISMLLAQLELDINQRALVNKWTEVSAATELEFLRSLMDHNRGQSFETISAYGPNAAIVHYKPTEDASLGGRRVFIGNQSTYLLDSGGQYLDGTTDITRTIHYGQPSELQRETYTRVLMGAIDMMSLVFEQSARSAYKLGDLIARRHLLELGLDYKHGTGHGIGLYSLVHEQPPLIEHYASAAGQRQTLGAAAARQPQPGPPTHSEPAPLEPNMFSSVEPGYYKTGEFGIRLENIVVTQRATGLGSRPNHRQPSPSGADAGRLLRFEPISLVPFEPRLMKLELLSNKQKAWLNSYNLMVRLRLTQQINYYLSKLRNLNGAQPIQVQGITSSSRLYQRLASASSQQQPAGELATSVTNRTSDAPQQIQLGYYNFLRLDGAVLQDKLELAHKWIMSKTELIPLDTPQSMLAAPSAGGQLFGRGGSARHDTEQREGPLRSQQVHLEAQRLMLAYMSAAPFNDAEAASVAVQLAGSGGNSSAPSNQSGQARPAGCSGRYECDLLLLDSISPTTYGEPGAAQRARRLPTQRSWPPPVESGYELDEPSDEAGWLPELFQLGGSQRASVPMSVGSLICIGLLVLLQLAVTTYMCREKLQGRRRPAAPPAGAVGIPRLSQPTIVSESL